jgi:hypothetical protein
LYGEYQDQDFYLEWSVVDGTISDLDHQLHLATEAAKKIALLMGGELQLKYDFKPTEKERHETNI